MGRGVASLLGLAVLLFGGAEAEAHKGQVHRTLHLELSGSKLVVLAHLSVSGDTRGSALKALADLDRDGRLSEAERTALQNQLAARALGGVRLLVGTATVSLQKVQAKLLLPADGPVEVAVHGLAELPEAARELELRTEPRAEPLLLRLVPGARRLVPEGRARRGPKGLVEVPIGAGDALRLRVLE